MEAYSSRPKLQRKYFPELGNLELMMDRKMCSLLWLKRMSLLACIFNTSFLCANSQGILRDNVTEGVISIDDQTPIGNTDEDFVCATLDWWPKEKCDYGNCSWDNASLLNLDLNNKILMNAVKAFSTLKIRLGGSLQDRVIYETEDDGQPCPSFTYNPSELFNFSQGCLPLNRWDQLNAFFKESGAKVIFGLNALPGRTILPNGSAVGDWDYDNAESLIRYTVKNNYSIFGWELGNELSGHGWQVSISAEQYASDTGSLEGIVQEIYKGIEPKALIVAPAGNVEPDWYKEFIDKTTEFLDVVTHHIYSLGPGSDEHLVDKILDPSFLDHVNTTFQGLQNILKGSNSSAVAWVGEAGGAYNSGRHLVTDAFVSSFWYLDQLGMSATYDTKTYCRQTLIGGNYGLLNTATFVPNPDYYSALLWHRLMGRNVLDTSFSGTRKIRAYAHCAKLSEGITLLLINLDGNTTVHATYEFNNVTQAQHHDGKPYSIKARLTHGFVGEMAREEYHLTANGGDLHSQTMLLNGNALHLNSADEIPSLEPLLVNSTGPISVKPYSIAFIHMPNVVLAACSQEGSRS